MCFYNFHNFLFHCDILILFVQNCASGSGVITMQNQSSGFTASTPPGLILPNGAYTLTLMDGSLTAVMQTLTMLTAQTISLTINQTCNTSFFSSSLCVVFVIMTHTFAFLFHSVPSLVVQSISIVPPSLPLSQNPTQPLATLINITQADTGFTLNTLQLSSFVTATVSLELRLLVKNLPVNAQPQVCLKMEIHPNLYVHPA